MKSCCLALFWGELKSPCCWRATGRTLQYFLFSIVTYLHWRCSSDSVESWRGFVLQRAAKGPWLVEVRQVLGFTLWTLFQQVWLLLCAGLDILLRNEESCGFPPSPSAFCFCEEKQRWILCPILASLFEVKGQEQHQGAARALIHLWDEFSSSSSSADVPSQPLRPAHNCLHGCSASCVGNNWNLKDNKTFCQGFKLGAMSWVWFLAQFRKYIRDEMGSLTEWCQPSAWRNWRRPPLRGGVLEEGVLG